MDLEMEFEVEDPDEVLAEETEALVDTSIDELNSSTELEEPKLNDTEDLVILCRSIRIGSYKVFANDGYSNLPVSINSKGFKFRVPALEGVSEVQITLTEPDLAQVLGHFGRSLQLLFLFASSACGDRIRKLLHMTPGGHYFDPDGKDDCQKIFTFLIEEISDDAKSYIRNNFPGEHLFKEIDLKVANEILVKSTPGKILPPVSPNIPPQSIPVSITPMRYIVLVTRPSIETTPN